jgi:NTE family protein
MNMPFKAAGAKVQASPQRPPFERIALVLQGGGALGAYQAGVYEALAQAQLHPDWVAGISIGAVNAALIAGNAPELRVEKLRRFWETVTSEPLAPWRLLEAHGDVARKFANRWHGATALLNGAPGLFSPRWIPPFLAAAGTPDATSFYDTSALKSTLERLVDFDRINSGNIRFSVGAVNVTTGNFVYFDNSTHRIRPEHIMASGALPPGLPAVEIDGELYWDGGLVSNTPLQWVFESADRQDTLAFQVDLWSARGTAPRTLAEVITRQKEIQYSSRTRASTDQFRNAQKLRCALSGLIAKVPEELKAMPEYALLLGEADRNVYNIIQLIYRSKRYEGDWKDFEFSSRSMEDHWSAGRRDTVRTLRHPEVLQRPNSADGLFTFDVETHGRLS